MVSRLWSTRELFHEPADPPGEEPGAEGNKVREGRRNKGGGVFSGLWGMHEGSHDPAELQPGMMQGG